MENNLQTWANIATIISVAIAIIALAVSLYVKNKVNKLEIKMTKKINQFITTESQTKIINPNIENLNIYPKVKNIIKKEQI